MTQIVQTNGIQPLSKTWELSLYELQRTPQVRKLIHQLLCTVGTLGFSKCHSGCILVKPCQEMVLGYVVRLNNFGK